MTYIHEYLNATQGIPVLQQLVNSREEKHKKSILDKDNVFTLFNKYDDKVFSKNDRTGSIPASNTILHPRS